MSFVLRCGFVNCGVVMEMIIILKILWFIWIVVFLGKWLVRFLSINLELCSVRLNLLSSTYIISKESEDVPRRNIISINRNIYLDHSTIFITIQNTCAVLTYGFRPLSCTNRNSQSTREARDFNEIYLFVLYATRPP